MTSTTDLESNPPKAERLQILIRRLYEIETEIQSLAAGQVDAVVNAEHGSPILLHEARTAIVESQSRYRRLLSRMSAMVFELAPDGTTLFVSGPIAEMTGYSADDLQGRNWWSIFLSEDQHRQVAELQRRFESGGDVSNFELSVTVKDGTQKVWEFSSANTWEPSGRLRRIVGVVTDVTARKCKEELLRFTQFAVDRSTIAAFWTQPDARFLYVNEAACRLLGYSRNVLGTLTVHDVDPNFPREMWPAFWDDVRRSGAKTFESQLRKNDGSLIPVEVRANFVEFNGQEFFCSFAQDISERKRAVEEQARLVAILEATSDFVGMADRHGKAIYINRAGRQMLGLDPGEDLANTSIAKYSPPWAAEVIFEQGIPSALKYGVWNGETAFVSRGGREIPVSQVIISHKQTDGTVEFFSTIARDLTGHKSLEEQLRQSQKMEAVGRLAGGIAHDFNNMLTVIIGCSDLAAEEDCPPEVAREMMGEVHKAGERAAALTRQLLAFSRQQVLAPVELNLGSMILGMQPILPRLIGEHIDLKISVGSEPALVVADPVHIEQVLLNLVVNSRDAMPHGGQLTIATQIIQLDEKSDFRGKRFSVIPPGCYVRLSVVDTGCGMEESTLERIFEPFFSTKAPGTGTGLGLPTAYGIIQQSGGHFEVLSQPEAGTQFNIYLPLVSRSSARESDSQTLVRESDSVLSGKETVLLVEDEDVVRTVAHRVLSAAGYTVLEASSGQAAIDICEQQAETIDLLVSDVVMPQMSGPQLAQHLAQTRPQMKVLFVSGYADDAVVDRGVLAAESAFLQKPFTPQSLAHKVREVLDQ